MRCLVFEGTYGYSSRYFWSDLRRLDPFLGVPCLPADFCSSLSRCWLCVSAEPFFDALSS